MVENSNATKESNYIYIERTPLDEDLWKGNGKMTKGKEREQGEKKLIKTEASS